MRVTSNMYYKNIYGNNNSKLSKELFDVNKQISSGLSIQYAHDDIRTFTETMRLDNEITTLSQVTKSVESGSKVSNQTDSVLNEFQTSLERTNVLLIQSSNASQNDASMDAIASELKEIEKHLTNLSNTSINGKYLFSGSSTNVKPIDKNGIYQGNDKVLNVFSGNDIFQQYNLTGANLFLGEEKSVPKEITSNVKNKNLFDNSALSASSEIRDLMGDKDDVSPNTSYFYINGTKSNGTTFKEKLSYTDTDTISSLLDDIGKAYGNDTNVNVVNVQMNSMGEITIEDKIFGSSKLDFHMVGAIDYTDANGGLANVNDIDDLETNGGETTYPPTGKLYIKEFIKSGYISASGASAIEGTIYDRVEFSKEGSFLTAGISQILKDDNTFAKPSTKISEVADISKGTTSTLDDTLDGTSLILVGKTIDGDTYDVKIDFKSTANGGSSFSLDTDGDGAYDDGSYDIFNTQSPRVAVDADEMTYQQLLDVTNMIVTNILPAANTEADYDEAIENSLYKGVAKLTYDGKMQFEDSNYGESKASIALYDSVSDDFSLNVDSNGDGTNDSCSSSAIVFNANNTLTIRDAKTDFFSTFNKIIKSVENHKLYPDANSGDIRSVGAENAIAMLDDLKNHVGRSHSLVGSQSNALQNSLERTQLLEISTMTLRSETLDTDLAEASMNLAQLNLNYQAMLSTVGKISKLSLVNYL